MVTVLTVAGLGREAVGVGHRVALTAVEDTSSWRLVEHVRAEGQDGLDPESMEVVLSWW